MKHRCPCGKIATWDYAPSDGEAYRCDDCVSRGCSCNVIDEACGKEERDDKGRLLPCCEWWEDPYGVDDTEPEWVEYKWEDTQIMSENDDKEQAGSVAESEVPGVELRDALDSMIRALDETNHRTVWLDSTNGIFAFITYRTETAEAARIALRNAGLLCEEVLQTLKAV